MRPVGVGMRCIVLIAALLAACSPQSDERNDLPAIAGAEVPPSEGDQPQNSVPAAPGPANIAAANESGVVSEAPFSPTSAQGAANVVQTYYALIEARKYGEAHKRWAERPGDLADGTFADRFQPYAEYHAEVFAPGRIEGAAGSLYVTVPVRTYGRMKTGERFEEPAIVTLRRVNDVPGSTAEQRRWRIVKIDTPPRPH